MIDSHTELLIFHITFGILKGSVLGPILFLLFVDGLWSTLRDFSVNTFADDWSLSVVDFSASDVETKQNIFSCFYGFDKENNKIC